MPLRRSYGPAVYRVLAAVAAAVLLAGFALAHAVDGSGPASGSRSAAATSSSHQDGGGSSAAGSSPGSAHGGKAPRALSNGSTANGGARSSADGEKATGGADSGYRLPAHKAGRSAAAPLLGAGLPRGGSGRATLVSGFPTRVVPLAPGSRVSTNSVSPSGGRLQVSLVATRDRGPEAVLGFYRARLGGLGFSEKPTHAVGGSAAVAFERGSSSVVVTVTPARPLTYSVFAILASGAS